MPLKPLDPSRQIVWQKKMVAAGLCSRCGQPRNLYSCLCDHCAKKRGGKWVPGGRGRPPKWAYPDLNERHIPDDPCCVCDDCVDTLDAEIYKNTQLALWLKSMETAQEKNDTRLGRKAKKKLAELGIHVGPKENGQPQ